MYEWSKTKSVNMNMVYPKEKEKVSNRIIEQMIA